MSKRYQENGIRIRIVKRPTSRKARKRYAELARRKAAKDAALYSKVVDQMLEGQLIMDTTDGAYTIGYGNKSTTFFINTVVKSITGIDFGPQIKQPEEVDGV
jgi:hypothetical protein